MLNKDIINRRLETGITYAEFSYMLIQGYDFLKMYEDMGCIMQVEGSDQWGNITTGIDLIRKIKGEEAYAFTMPLILDSTGKKFGKSEGNALWLNEDKTSSYELYQYLINTEDEMIEHYLKVFTFLTPEEIIDIMKKHNEEPHLRLAQKALAREIITDLHSRKSYDKAVMISEALFSGNISELSSNEIRVAFKGVPSFEIEVEENIIDFLVNNKVASSKREAREFVSNGSITVNGEKITDLEFVVKKDNSIDDEFTIVRRGKKKYYVGVWK